MAIPRPRLAPLFLILAIVATVVPLTQKVAIAVPNPVATDERTYQMFGRVFPDPQGCLAYGLDAAELPDGVSPWAKGRVCADQFLSYQEAIEGSKFLQERFPRFVKVVRLDQAFDNPNYMSAGIPRTIGVENGNVKVLARDRRPLYLIKVTDAESSIPEKDRHHFAYSLSIHGIERAGIEGGIRAMEDLVTWAACEDTSVAKGAPACVDEGPFPKPIVETPTDKPVPTAGNVLKESVLYFVLANPDGWSRGQTAPVETENGAPNANYLPGPMFQRFNGNGVDLNRDFPTIGFTFKRYSPGSEPETKAFVDVLSKVRSNLSSGHFTGGLDLHGMNTARAFSYTLLGAGQHDYRKNSITQDTSIRTWQDQTQRLAWSPWIADADADGEVDPGETTTSDPRYGGRIPAPVADQWGSVIDTLGYQITGGFGDWFDSPLGLDAVGIDNEMYASHLINNIIFEPALEQTHIDGNKGLIYSQIAALLEESDITYEPGGKVGYIYNPNRLQVPASARPSNPGLPAQNDIEVVVPCGDQIPDDPEVPDAPAAPPVRTKCGEATFVAGSQATLEFDTLGPNDGIWNGGITVEVTQANANGIYPQGTGEVALDYNDEGQWSQIQQSRTGEGANYHQAGKIVTVNDPEAGQWRVRFTSPAQLPARVKIDFNPVTAESSPGQTAIDASSMDFFSDLNKYVPEDSKLTPIDVNDVVVDRNFARQFDSIVVVNNLGSKTYLTEQLGLTAEQADAYFGNLRHYTETGGNLVLTDAALQALNGMGLLPDTAIKQDLTNPAGSFNFSLVSGQITYNDPEQWPLAAGVDLPGASEQQAGRRQAVEPVPLGYTPDGGLDNTPRMPIWSVTVPEWSSLCAEEDPKLCTTALVTQNQFNNQPTNPGKVDLGEIKLGDGRIRIAGELFPDPVFLDDEGGDNRFGLASYALTYTSYIVLDNLLEWANPGRIEPRKPPYLTSLSFRSDSATSGYYTDTAAIKTVLVDDLGEPIAGAPLRLSFSGAVGMLDSVTATTDQDGVAKFRLPLNQEPGEYGLTVVFAGSDTHVGSVATQSITVQKELTTLLLDVSGGGSKRFLTAKLKQNDGPVVTGRTISFYADGSKIGQAVTGSNGVATLQVPTRYRSGAHTYQAVFDGDTLFETSSREVRTKQ